MPKTEITYTDYLVLVGLVTIAQRHNRAVYDVVDAVAEIVGDPEPDLGHVGDACWTGRNASAAPDVVATMLARFNIPVPRRPPVA